MTGINDNGRAAGLKGSGYFYIFLMFMTIIIVVFVFQMILMQWGTTSLTKYLTGVHTAQDAIQTVCRRSLEKPSVNFVVTLPTDRIIIIHQCSDILNRDQLISPDHELTIKDDYITNMHDLCSQPAETAELKDKSVIFAWGETKLDQPFGWKALSWFVRGVGFSTGVLGAIGGWYAGNAISHIGQHTVVKELQMDVYYCDYTISAKAFFRASSGQSQTDYSERLYVETGADANGGVVRLQHVVE